MAQYPVFDWGTATYLSVSDTIGVTINFSITGAPFASDKTYFWQCPAIPYLSGTILMCRPAGSPTWPGWQEGWYPAGVLPLGHYYFTITLPAGQTTVQHEFGSVKSLFVLPSGFGDPGAGGVRTPLALMSDPTLSTATATVSGVGTATVNGASSVAFAEDNTLEWVATGAGFVKWIIDGVEYTSATVFTLGGTADSNGTAYFDTTINITGSYTSLGTNGCALSYLKTK